MRIRQRSTHRPRSSRSSSFHVASLLAVLAGASAAMAQGVLIASPQTIESNAGYSGFFGVNQDYRQASDLSGLDVFMQQQSYKNAAGFEGIGYADRGATFAPANPGIGGSFFSAVLDGCVSGSIRQTNPLNISETGWGWSYGSIDFTVATPQSWSWIGSMQGQSDPAAAYSYVEQEMFLQDLSGGGFMVYDFQSSTNGSSNWFYPFSYGGVLNPGTYRVSWEVLAEVWGPGGPDNGLCLACHNSTFSMIPAPGATALFVVAGFAAFRRRR